MMVILYLRKCLRMNYKQRTDEPEQRLQDEENEEDKKLIVMNIYVYFVFIYKYIISSNSLKIVG